MKNLDRILAKRYAAAYMDFGGAAAAAAKPAAMLAALVSLKDASSPVMALLMRPLVPPAVKLEVLSKACPGGDPRALALMALLVNSGRLGLLPEICSQCSLLADEEAGILRAEVTSRYPLDPAELAALEKTLSAVSGRRVSASAKISEKVIGGFEAGFGGFLLDATLSGRLARLRKKITT